MILVGFTRIGSRNDLLCAFIHFQIFILFLILNVMGTKMWGDLESHWR